MPGIGIITNPHSKLNRRHPETIKLLGYILEEKGQIELTKSLEELDKVAHLFLEKNIEILAINGGDGTIGRTLSAFIRVYKDKPLPKLVILPGGTINVLASNLRIKGKPEQVLLRLLEHYSSGKPFKTAKVRTLNVEENYGFLYADGTAYNFLEKFYEKKTGFIGAMILIIKLAISKLKKGPLFDEVIKQKEIKIAFKSKEPETHKTSMVFASTIPRIPFGFKFFPLCFKNGGQMQFHSYTIDPRKVLKFLPRILTKNCDEGVHPDKLTFCVDDLYLEDTSIYKYTLDGDLFSAKKNYVKILTGPNVEFLII